MLVATFSREPTGDSAAKVIARSQGNAGIDADCDLTLLGAYAYVQLGDKAEGGEAPQRSNLSVNCASARWYATDRLAAPSLARNPPSAISTARRSLLTNTLKPRYIRAVQFVNMAVN
jgi:hypothetical protein